MVALQVVAAQGGHVLAAVRGPVYLDPRRLGPDNPKRRFVFKLTACLRVLQRLLVRNPQVLRDQKGIYL